MNCPTSCFPIRKTLALLSGCVVGLVSPLTLCAQSGGDAQWTKLKNYEVPDLSVAGLAAPSGDSRPSAAQFLQRADELRAYAASNPASGHGAEARRLEALMLLYARSSGLSAVAARCDALVSAVRVDPTLPADSRFTVAFLADFDAMQSTPFPSNEAGLAKAELTLRALAAEFPGVPAAGEGLLRLAGDSDDTRAGRIAQDLLKMNVSPEVRSGAQLLLDRLALAGESLPTLLGTALSAKGLPGPTKNRIIFLYAWSTQTDGLYNAQQITSAAPSGATIIGLNFDLDVAAARKLARDRSLPGTQLYSSTGLDPKLVRQLQPSGHDLFLIADRSGVIRVTSAGVDLAAKIQKTNK